MTKDRSVCSHVNKGAKVNITDMKKVNIADMNKGIHMNEGAHLNKRRTKRR